MKLALRKLTSKPHSFHFEADDDWWNRYGRSEHEPGDRMVEPLCFDLQAHTLGEDLFLVGGMHGVVLLECSRCIARYRHALREAFRLVLEPTRGRVPVDPEGVAALAAEGLWLGDDLEVGWYKGEELRLDRFFAEVVALASPLKPLCSEECAGLCPRCGENRNVVACECEQVKPNSPFAVLEALRGGGAG